MAYTGSPSTDVNDEIRLLIGDTSTSTGSEIFSDGEITYFSANYSNAPLAASAAVKSLIGTSRANTLVTVIEKQVGDLRLKYGSAGSNETLRGKARELRMLGVRKVKPYAGGISEADKDAQESDADWNKPAFSVGMHDIASTSS